MPTIRGINMSKRREERGELEKWEGVGLREGGGVDLKSGRGEDKRGKRFRRYGESERRRREGDVFISKIGFPNSSQLYFGTPIS